MSKIVFQNTGIILFNWNDQFNLLGTFYDPTQNYYVKHLICS